MKKGLVLEGGAMRGIYTAGVLDVFMENEIVADGVMGVSAGCVHGSSYVSGQCGRNIRYTKKYCADWRFMSYRSLLLTGSIVGTRFSYEEIPYRLDPFDFEAFFDSPKEFYAVVTNLETGMAEYLPVRTKDGNQNYSLDVIRASASMPMVSKTVTINGKKYLDGGTSDSIPIQAFRKMGYEKNIVVLTQPKDYKKQPEKMISMIEKKYARYPQYVTACRERYMKYNDTIQQISKLEAQGDTLVIRPSRKVEIGRIERNPKVVQAQYDLGRKDAKAMLDKIRIFME